MRIIITGETSDLLNQAIILLSKVPGIDIVICNGETELEATNAELVKALEDIKRELLEANPHCGKLYLFKRCVNGFDIAAKALRTDKGRENLDRILEQDGRHIQKGKGTHEYNL